MTANLNINPYFILFFIVSLHRVTSNKCVPIPKGMDITEVGYSSPIVVRAKITKIVSENHTATVTDLMKSDGGSLKVGDTFQFGLMKKGKGCPRLKKKKEYIFFLERSSDSKNSFYRIKYNPVSKLSLRKKLKPVLCDGCVKPPKFDKKSKRKLALKEGQKVTINCKVSGNPKPRAQFWKDNKLLPKKINGMRVSIKKRGGGGKIKIKSVKMSHAGIYKCKATNLAGSANLTIVVTVVKDDCLPCGKDKKDYCMNGRCCAIPSANETSCRCENGYTGLRCNKKIFVPHVVDIITTVHFTGSTSDLEARYQKQTIAVMGVCIALLIILFICYTVYCQFKKSRSKIRKQLLNGHAVTMRENRQPVTGTRGILADDNGNRDVEMTNYRSTSLSDAQPVAFAQRPQTYDEVILPSASEHASFIERPNTADQYNQDGSSNSLANRNGSQSQISRVESGSKRKRLKGIAIVIPAPEGTPVNRGVERLKLPELGLNSKSSSTSSLSTSKRRGQHSEPDLPLEQSSLLAHIAQSGVYKPPAYSDDEVDNAVGAIATSPENVHDRTNGHQASGSASDSVGGGTHRVTTFDTNGKIQEEMLERDDSSLQVVTPHSPSVSSQSSYQRSLKSPPHSPYSPTHHSSTSPPGRFIALSQENPMMPGASIVSGNVYPYYEHNKPYPASPATSHRDNEDSVHIPDTSLGLNSPKSQTRTKSEAAGNMRNYAVSPPVGMPYHPVTIASAQHHKLNLLSNESSDSPLLNQDKALLAGSTVSLSSSSVSLSSQKSIANDERDSPSIQV